LLHVQSFLDWAVAFLAAVLVPTVPTVVAFGVSWLRAHTKLKISAAQQAKLDSVLDTGVGMLTVALRNGIMTVPEIHVANPTILSVANYVLDHAADEAAAVGLTNEGVAHTLIGLLGRALDADPSTPSSIPYGPAAPPIVFTSADAAAAVSVASAAASIPPAH
jgi:hypothetical protein